MTIRIVRNVISFRPANENFWNSLHFTKNPQKDYFRDIDDIFLQFYFHGLHWLKNAVFVMNQSLLCCMLIAGNMKMETGVGLFLIPNDGCFCIAFGKKENGIHVYKRQRLIFMWITKTRGMDY